MFDPLLAGLLSRNLFGLLPKNWRPCVVYIGSCMSWHHWHSLHLCHPQLNVCVCPTSYTTVHCHWKPSSQLNSRKKSLITHHQVTTIISIIFPQKQPQGNINIRYFIGFFCLHHHTCVYRCHSLTTLTWIPASSMFIWWVTCWWFRITCWWPAGDWTSWSWDPPFPRCTYGSMKVRWKIYRIPFHPFQLL